MTSTIDSLVAFLIAMERKIYTYDSNNCLTSLFYVYISHTGCTPPSEGSGSGEESGSALGTSDEGGVIPLMAEILMEEIQVLSGISIIILRTNVWQKQ